MGSRLLICPGQNLLGDLTNPWDLTSPCLARVAKFCNQLDRQNIFPFMQQNGTPSFYYGFKTCTFMPILVSTKTCFKTWDKGFVVLLGVLQ
jgi:hypothetical protein